MVALRYCPAAVTVLICHAQATMLRHPGPPAAALLSRSWALVGLFVAHHPSQLAPTSVGVGAGEGLGALALAALEDDPQLEAMQVKLQYLSIPLYPYLCTYLGP